MSEVNSEYAKKVKDDAELAALMRDQKRELQQEGSRAIQRPKGHATLQEEKHQLVPLAPVARARRWDEVPTGYRFDLELGELARLETVVAPDEFEAERRWRAQAREIIGYLTSALAPTAVAMSDVEPKEAAYARCAHIAPAELSALHRELFRPGWQRVLLAATESAVTVRIENELRRANLSRRRKQLRDWEALSRDEVAHLRKLGQLRADDYMTEERAATTGAEILHALHSNPPNLMGDVPRWLTAEMLDQLIEQTTLGAGGPKGGWTPETAVALIADSGADSGAFTAAMKRRMQEKVARKKSKRKAPG